MRDDLAPPFRRQSFFRQNILQDTLVQAQVRDELLQLAVLGLQLSIYRKTKGKPEMTGGAISENIESKGSDPSSRNFTTCAVPSAGGVGSGSP